MDWSSASAHDRCCMLGLPGRDHGYQLRSGSKRGFELCHETYLYYRLGGLQKIFYARKVVENKGSSQRLAYPAGIKVLEQRT